VYPKKKIAKKKLRQLRLAYLKERIDKFADDINKNTPQSELWFRGKFNKEPIERIYGKHRDNDFLDRYNTPLDHAYIPDIINYGYKFIIEVDGEIHNNLKQAYKDLAKNVYYNKRGYKVFRVVAYSEPSYNKFLNEFKEYIETQHKTSLIALYNEHKNITQEEPYSTRQAKIVKYNRLDTHIVVGIPVEVGPKVILRKAQ
jgi:very-short-patch-repair endonuclease